MELLIGGQWVEAVSGHREEVTSPFDGSVVGSVSLRGEGGETPVASRLRP